MSGGGVLPNGSVTQSDREYVDTWRSFSGPILDIIAPLGFRRYGFDPGVLFSRVSGEMLDLPTDVIAAINAKIAALQARLAAAEALLGDARKCAEVINVNGYYDGYIARIDAHLAAAPTPGPEGGEVARG